MTDHDDDHDPDQTSITEDDARRMDAGVRVGAISMSTTIGAIAAAIAKAQPACAPVVKDRDADLGRGGRYRYATLHAMLESIIAAYSAHAVAVLQGAELVADGVCVTTMLAHESGEWIASSLTMPFADGKPQTIGSAVTYARRYAIQSMCGIAAEDDDDGAAAQASMRDGPRERSTIAARVRAQTSQQSGGASQDELDALGTDLRRVANLVADTTDGAVPSWRELIERASGIRPWPEHPTAAQVFRARSGLDKLRKQLTGTDGPPEGDDR